MKNSPISKKFTNTRNKNLKTRFYNNIKTYSSITASTLGKIFFLGTSHAGEWKLQNTNFPNMLIEREHARSTLNIVASIPNLQFKLESGAALYSQLHFR